MVVVVASVVVAGRFFFWGLLLLLEDEVSFRAGASSAGFFCGLFLRGFSTQHRSALEGQGMSSRTSSQMREAMAWIHLPGQVSLSAVLVMVLNKPEI